MRPALDAVHDRGRVKVRIQAGPDGSAIVEVHDDGPGVPESQRARLFEAFYTTKKEGTGLGLLSAKKCAELHGGKIEVLASPLGGVCFRAHLADAADA
jgi:signal transduction histidine kinase